MKNDHGLLTISRIAELLHVQRHKVARAAGMVPIAAAAMRGTTRLFDKAGVEKIRAVLSDAGCIKQMLYSVDGLAAVLDMAPDRVRYWCQSPALRIVSRFRLQTRSGSEGLFTEADRDLIAVESGLIAATAERLGAELKATRHFIETGIPTLAEVAEASDEVKALSENDGWLDAAAKQEQE